MTSDEDRKGKDRDETEKSERKLSTLLSNIPGMVYRCKNDKDWTMEYLSEGCKDLTGYDPSELIDNDKVSWAEVIHSEHREKVREEIQESIKKEEPFTFNYKISTKNGGEKTLWELGRPVLDSEGNVEALEGFMTDITDKVESKKRAEERVEKAKRLYKAAIELERCKTKQEVYEHALESAEDILGFYTCGILIEDEGELVVKGKTEKSALEIGDRFSADEIFPGQVLKTGEASLVRDVSERNDVEASMDILNSGLDVPIGEIGVLLTASDEVGYYDDFDLEMAKILAAHIDKTVKRIEEEKEKSLVLDTTEELVVYQDADQKINWVNRVAAETVDKAPEELKGKKCYEVWGTGDELCEGCPVKKTIDTGTGQEGERKDEEGNHWLIRASPEKNEEGEVVGVVEVALDITKRKEAEERLKENKEKIERLFES
ncbi:MAG: PAS domain-containing protein, partial [Candidatus Thermoplasmatota archaeon]|nr:PAS domain-containing protein [Candidatus Thermoplasmatota archaeon]